MTQVSERHHSTMEEPKQALDATEYAERVWEKSWTYIRTVVDTVYNPFLILDKDLRVLAANRSFYKLFHVTAKNTERKYVYELGNGEWNIPALKALLEVILPRNTFFEGFEVNHQFPSIGKRIMLLNGRRVYRQGEASEIFPPIILLAMEDITPLTIIATKLADYAKHIEKRMEDRTHYLEAKVKQLKKDIGDLQHPKKK